MKRADKIYSALSQNLDFGLCSEKERKFQRHISTEEVLQPFPFFLRFILLTQIKKKMYRNLLFHFAETTNINRII